MEHQLLKAKLCFLWHKTCVWLFDNFRYESSSIWWMSLASPLCWRQTTTGQLSTLCQVWQCAWQSTQCAQCAGAGSNVHTVTHWGGDTLGKYRQEGLLDITITGSLGRPLQEVTGVCVFYKFNNLICKSGQILNTPGNVFSGLWSGSTTLYCLCGVGSCCPAHHLWSSGLSSPVLLLLIGW